MEPHQWFFSNLIENNLLGSAAAVATIPTVFISAYKHFKDKNNEKMRASQNLYLELGDTLRSLDMTNPLKISAVWTWKAVQKRRLCTS